MRTLLLLVFLYCILIFNTNAQSLAIKPVYHFGTYTGGEVQPNFDWEVSLDIPLTYQLEFNTSFYYYNWKYEDHTPRWQFFEKYWLIGIGFTYIFSENPLLE